MHVIKRAALVSFWEIHPDAKAPLASWYSIISKSEFSDFNELRKTFQQADYVEGKYIFNAGQPYRLITAIHFNTQKVFIRHVLTHAEYDRGKWKKT